MKRPLIIQLTRWWLKICHHNQLKKCLANYWQLKYFISIERENPNVWVFSKHLKSQTKNFISKFLTAKKLYIKGDDKVSKICVFYTNLKEHTSTQNMCHHQVTPVMFWDSKHQTKFIGLM